MRLVIALAAVIGAVALVRGAADAVGASDLATALVQTALVAASYVAVIRLVERRAVTELSGAGAIRELTLGIGVGAALFGAVMLIVWLAGAVSVRPGAGAGALVSALALAVMAGVTEEIVFRGILYRIVEESLGSWIAIALTAALFGVLHGKNPGATVISSVAVALEAGVLLAAAFALTRRLWLPIGLHLAWNFVQGGVFGARVSGTAAPGLLRSDFHGDPLLTGGAFGPEASIVAIAVCTIAGAIVLVVARRRGRLVAPRWSSSRLR